MRFNLPVFRRLADSLGKRDWFGVAFELIVVVVGVLLGLQASRWAADREERQYHNQMVAALDATLKVYVQAGHEVHEEIASSLTGYERRVAAGERPPPPYWRLDKLERPPTLAWEALVATGIAKSVKPELVFEIARFFSLGDGLGDRYERYNAFTESQVVPYVSTPDRFYGSDGNLLPEFAAHVDRLRELLFVSDHLTGEADMIRRTLKEI